MRNPTSSDEKRRYQVVADQIRTLIEVDRIRAGSRLPAERDLAALFGMSRQLVREALIALEVEGQIEIRGGSGAYVCTAYTGNAATSLPGGTQVELMQARITLERTVIARAAARVNSRGLRRIGDALDAMRADLACGRTPVNADRQFHLSIAEMGGNVVLAGFVAMLFDGLHGEVPLSLGRQIEVVQAWQAALAEHEAIFRALEAGDPVAASAALCTHLQASRGRWADEPVEPVRRRRGSSEGHQPLRA